MNSPDVVPNSVYVQDRDGVERLTVVQYASSLGLIAAGCIPKGVFESDVRINEVESAAESLFGLHVAARSTFENFADYDKKHPRSRVIWNVLLRNARPHLFTHDPFTFNDPYWSNIQRAKRLNFRREKFGLPTRGPTWNHSLTDTSKCFADMDTAIGIQTFMVLEEIKKSIQSKGFYINHIGDKSIELINDFINDRMPDS
jgi:hypothetical protein